MLSHAQACSGSQSLLEREMQLDLTDEEAAALLSLPNRVIADDRYPLSPRIRLLRAVRAKLPGRATATAGKIADARRTKARASATRWSAATLGNCSASNDAILTTLVRGWRPMSICPTSALSQLKEK